MGVRDAGFEMELDLEFVEFDLAVDSQPWPVFLSQEFPLEL